MFLSLERSGVSPGDVAYVAYATVDASPPVPDQIRTEDTDR